MWNLKEAVVPIIIGILGRVGKMIVLIIIVVLRRMEMMIVTSINGKLGRWLCLSLIEEE